MACLKQTLVAICTGIYNIDEHHALQTTKRSRLLPSYFPPSLDKAKPCRANPSKDKPNQDTLVKPKHNWSWHTSQATRIRIKSEHRARPHPYYCWIKPTTTSRCRVRTYASSLFVHTRIIHRLFTENKEQKTSNKHLLRCCMNTLC